MDGDGRVRPTVLELRVGGVPFPHGDPDGGWRHRHAVRAEGPSVLDHQAVADFLAYERAHGRDVVVDAAPELADWATWPTPSARPRPDAAPTQCCTPGLSSGCGAALVCHGTPAATAATILADGWLRPPPDVQASTWGEPADYFEHVMFANGRCTAPEAVAASRRLGRDLVPADLDAGYEHAARLYFRWDALTALPEARFDGVHPIKVRGPVELGPLLVAVVVSEEHAEAVIVAAGDLRSRVVVLPGGGTPSSWAAGAMAAAAARAPRSA
jgi:hypothetical protein